MKNDKKRQILFFISLIGIIVVLLTMGTTFAYQTIIVDYKEGSDNDLSLNAAKLDIDYTAGDKIELTNMPLLKDYKTADYTEFTIDNKNSSGDIAYSIDLTNLEYSKNIVSSDFKYTLVLINGESKNIIGSGDFSTLTGTTFKLYFNLGAYRNISKGNNEKVRLYLWLKETENDQNGLESTSFKGQIQISSMFSTDVNSIKTLSIKGNSIQTKVPSEYQQVEYIESTGTQYIKTGKLQNTVYGYEVEFESTGIVKSLDGYNLDGIFGVNNSGTDTKIWFGYNTETGMAYNSATLHGKSNTLSTISKVVLDDYYKKHIIKVYDYKLYYDGEYIQDIEKQTSTIASVELSLFKAEYFYSATKIYSVKLYDNNNDLIQYLKPCYRKSDNVIGMYDIVNDVFYTNAGTGAFKKGRNVSTPDVPTPDAPVKIESLGEYDETIEKYKIPITVSSKNIVNVPDMNIKPKSTYYYNYFPKNPNVLLEPSTTYTLSFDYIINSTDQTLSTGVGYGTSYYAADIIYGKKFPNETSGKQVITFTTPSTFNSAQTPYLQLRIVRADVAVTASVDISNVQLEKGSSATDYVPYKKPVTYNIYLDEPLRKVGDYYDYIDYSEGKVVRNIKSEYLNTVTAKSSNAGTYSIFLTDISKKPLVTKAASSNSVGYAMSNKFNYTTEKYGALGNTPNLIAPYITTGGVNRVAYTFDDSSIKTIELAQQKIGDGFEVQYVMNESEVEYIELPSLKDLDSNSIISVCSNNNVCASN